MMILWNILPWSLALVLGCDDKGAADDTGLSTPTEPTNRFDADGDGFDAEAYGGTDCDDTDPDVHPGALETWYDGVDQDCGGDSDYDADRDGQDSDVYGGADCDDSYSYAGPEALEICDDGGDQDCDGEIDEAPCGWTTDVAAGLWHEGEKPFLGTALAADCDVAGTGDLSVLVSAPGIPGIGPDSEGDWTGTEEGGVFTAADSSGFFPADAVTVINGASYAAFGTGLDCQGDLDGDGYRDLAVSAFDDGDPERMPGRTVVLLGPLSGAVDAAVADYEWVGSTESEHVSVENIGAVVRVSDVTGDGHADLVVGTGDSYSPWGEASSWTAEGGASMVFRGAFDQESHSGWADGVILLGALQGEMTLGDMNGDGVNDVVRNYAPDDSAPERCGVVYSGLDIAAAAAGDLLSADSGALAVLHCPGDTYQTDYVWKLRADQDLDQDGHADLFMTHTRGWSAFQGGAGVWSGDVEATSRLEAGFCSYGLGVRDVDFTRDADGLLTWAVSLDGSPDCPTYTGTPFRGRVAVFDDWTWSNLAFEDAWTWLAWDRDSYGLDPLKIGSREVAFSHEGDGGPRLWFADPTWTYDSATWGRLAVYELDALR